MSYNQGIFRVSRGLYPLENHTASDFVPTQYVVSGVVQSVHDFPRFGHPNNFNDLIQSGGDSAATKAEAKQYAMGLFAGSILILSIAVFWFFCLAMLKIAGQQKVGFFAGRLVRPNAVSPMESGVEVMIENEDGTSPIPVNEPGEHAQKSFKRRVIAVRSVFVIFGVLTIVAGILFYSKGVAALKSSLNEFHDGINLIQETAYKAINVTDSVIQAKDDIDVEIQPSIDLEAAGQPVCRVTNEELSTQIREAWALLVTNIQELKKLVEQNLGNFSDDLRRLIQLTEEIEDSLTSADIVFYILIAISIFIACFILIMLAEVVFASLNISNCFTRCITNAVIWPIFTLLLILAWISSTVFLISSLAGADFCVAPDNYVISVVEKYEGEFKSAIFAFILFYISGCTVRPAAEKEVVAIWDTIKLLNQCAHTLSELIGGIDPATVAAICGVDDTEAQTLQRIAIFIHDLSHAINRAMIGVLDLLSCKSFNPIYTTFVHDGTLPYGILRPSGIFFTTLTVAISSMMMMTFRAALYPIKDGTIASKDGEVEVVRYEHNGNEELEECADGGRFEDQQRSNVDNETLQAEKVVQIY
ncbi:hypothetical protein ACHAW6_005431 [Cyclotella cf. meneghiniana]